jgi:hypothetical protein
MCCILQRSSINRPTTLLSPRVPPIGSARTKTLSMTFGSVKDPIAARGEAIQGPESRSASADSNVQSNLGMAFRNAIVIDSSCQRVRAAIRAFWKLQDLNEVPRPSVEARRHRTHPGWSPFLLSSFGTATTFAETTASNDATQEKLVVQASSAVVQVS